METIIKDVNTLECILDGTMEPTNLSLSVLSFITNGFSEHQIIGEGGFGVVYMGILGNPMTTEHDIFGKSTVAVKKLFKTWDTISEKQFHREVDSMMKTRHPNIVRLLGYCCNTEQEAVHTEGSFNLTEGLPERLLCLEYISNGSLRDRVSDGLRGLEWHMRFEIIKGICEGLRHLHEMRIIHMDLKPANILLDDHMVPKIADFGISCGVGTHTTTGSKDLIYSRGYCAPEYIDTGKMSTKSDIYSLGVIILELVTGTNNDKPDKDNVLRKWKHRWNRSGKQTPSGYQQVSECIEMALRCMRKEPKERPSISHIIGELNQMEHTTSDGSDIEEKLLHLEDMIGIEPLELHFPFELYKQIPCLLQLANDTDDHFAVSIQLEEECQEWYCIKPNKNIIVRPRSNPTVTIVLQAQVRVPRVRKDKFTVWSTRVDEAFEVSSISTYMFQEGKHKVVDDVTLTAIIDVPHKLCTRVNPRPVSFAVYPLHLYFPFELHRMVPCSVDLTNNTNEYIAFYLKEKSGQSAERFLRLPMYGIVPPMSTYTVVVTTEKLQKQPPRQDYDLILQSTVVADTSTRPFSSGHEWDMFFTACKRMEDYVVVRYARPHSRRPEYQSDRIFRMPKGREKLVFDDVTIKAVFGRPADSSSERSHLANAANLTLQAAPPAIKILSVDKPSTRRRLFCFDVNQTEHLVIEGDQYGCVRIWNYETQRTMSYIKVLKNQVVSAKFVAQKHLFVAGSTDGVIILYNYKKKMHNATFREFNEILTMDVHPTHPYVLVSTQSRETHLLNWKDGQRKIVAKHSDLVRHVVFNPVDAHSFAGASEDHTVKVWSCNAPHSSYTLSGHLGMVNCLHYLIVGAQRQYLITGSNDQTAKIWNLQERICVLTLKAFVSPVISISLHPDFPVLITGSKDGTVHLWNSSRNFRLHRILSTTCDDTVWGHACLAGSRRVIIGQYSTISLLSLQNPSGEGTQTTDTVPGEGLKIETSPAPTEILDVHPVELHFNRDQDTFRPVALHLTNRTDARVAFRIHCRAQYRTKFLGLPLHGTVLPRSTYTRIITPSIEDVGSHMKESDLLVQSCIMGNHDAHPFANEEEYVYFFSLVKEEGKVLHEVTLKAVCAQEADTTIERQVPAKIKIVEDPYWTKFGGVGSLDVNPTCPGILTGPHARGNICIWDHGTLKSLYCSTDYHIGGTLVRFIAHNRIVHVTEFGEVNIYKYEVKKYETKMRHDARFRSGSISKIRVLAAHPTQPSLLISCKSGLIELWNQKKTSEWECTQSFEDSDGVLQAVFNPLDANSFVTASKDGKIKIWSLPLPYPISTLPWHMDQVNCLDYFTRSDGLYLISGSDDRTAKIWDMQKKICVQTLEPFAAAVTSVCSHPSRPLLITGSEYGLVHFWCSATFRIVNVIDIGSGRVVGLRCVVGTGRVVIGQQQKLALLELGEDESEAN